MTRVPFLPVLAASMLAVVALGPAACRKTEPEGAPRLSGHVEATEVRVAPEVGGRLIDLAVDEGSRVSAGDVLARLETTDTDLAIQRARAERAQADAQLRLLQAGSRIEDIHQGEAEASAAAAELESARAEEGSARADLDRFEQLLARNSGSRKQRDDAATRSQVADERVRIAENRVRAARAAVARLRAGARSQEIDAARARVAAVDAQIATLHESLRDATITAPSGGIITEKLVEPGELLAPHTPMLVLTDLDHAWANVYVDEPMVPRVRLGQAAKVFTDADDPPMSGTVSYISPRAEFTPRNVQTAEERSKLVYRIKIAVDNRQGVLKPGMPVEAELAPAAFPTTSAPGGTGSF
jgi:HlyD family secretion protein